MHRKILFFMSVLSIGLIGLIVFAHIYDDLRFIQYKKERMLELAELEKLPPSQKTPHVLYTIADLYLTLGYEQPETINAYIQASQAGHAHASYTLAVLSAHNKKMGHRLPAYDTLFDTAAQQGSLDAAFILNAREALKTIHTPLGYQDAFTKLATAADEGNIEAAFLLCWHGKEETSNTIILGTLQYCEQPLKNADPRAQYLMGRLHEQNPAEFHPELWDKFGIEKNTAKAVAFYQQAASQSYKPAIDRLSVLKNNRPLSVTKATNTHHYLHDPCLPCFE